MDRRKPSSYLRHKILTFIKNKEPENDFLDYKRQWEEDKGELIKDIFSFVNTVHHKDCYLVYGIKNSDISIIGVNNDKHRRDQEGIVNFLSHIHIVGDFIPQIMVNTIITSKFDKNHKNKLEIDVLTVKDTNHVPIYLTQTYKKGEHIYPGEIFSRIDDKDTGIRETVGYSRAESLWKKHFQLNLSIIDRYTKYLSKSYKWEYYDRETPNEHAHLSYKPDYKIRVNIIYAPYQTNKIIPFSLLFNNFNVSWVYLEFKYNNNRVVLKLCNFINGANALLYLPIKYLKLGNVKFEYYSCVKNTFDGCINDVLLNTYVYKNVNLYKNRVNDVIIKYDSKSQEKEFIQWFQNKFTLDSVHVFINLFMRINLKNFILKWYMGSYIDKNKYKSYISDIQKILFMRFITKEFHGWIKRKLHEI